MCNDFRFFTALRCVQNDRGRDGCVRNDRGKGAALRAVRNDREGMLCLGWQNLGRVIWSEGRNLKLEAGGCAMSLDSSLCSE